MLLLARFRLTAVEALDHLVKFGQHAFIEPEESTTGPRFKTAELVMATRNLLKGVGLDEETKMIEDAVKDGQTYAYVLIRSTLSDERLEFILKSSSLVL